MRIFVAAAMGLFALAAVPVQAMPIARLNGLEPNITLVAGGCVSWTPDLGPLAKV